MAVEDSGGRASVPAAPAAEPDHVPGNTPQDSVREVRERRDLFGRAQRLKLPDERKSITHKFAIGGQEGYVIVGMYREGAPGEIFIKMAKEGSTLSGFMDGLALTISIGLQYGVPLKTIVDKLTNTRFEPSGPTENPDIRYPTSVLDYIARWLGDEFLSPEYHKPSASGNDQAISSSDVPKTLSTKTVASDKQDRACADAPSCSTCGMLMASNGSCHKCANCGSTSGCS